mmetsp:Transcript_33375/g.84566  ORF Transcript_33375/g.84566 Transcript_33375/m.84566 type:complete len:451 (+) Transcript_33375:597-1949(+)
MACLLALAARSPLRSCVLAREAALLGDLNARFSSAVRRSGRVDEGVNSNTSCSSPLCCRCSWKPPPSARLNAPSITPPRTVSTTSTSPCCSLTLVTAAQPSSTTASTERNVERSAAFSRLLRRRRSALWPVARSRMRPTTPSSPPSPLLAAESPPAASSPSSPPSSLSPSSLAPSERASASASSAPTPHTSHSSAASSPAALRTSTSASCSSVATSHMTDSTVGADSSVLSEVARKDQARTLHARTFASPVFHSALHRSITSSVQLSSSAATKQHMARHSMAAQRTSHGLPDAAARCRSPCSSRNRRSLGSGSVIMCSASSCADSTASVLLPLRTPLRQRLTMVVSFLTHSSSRMSSRRNPTSACSAFSRVAPLFSNSSSSADENKSILSVSQKFSAHVVNVVQLDVVLMLSFQSSLCFARSIALALALAPLFFPMSSSCLRPRGSPLVC